MHEVTLGGERLGTGNKMRVDMRTYERSTHDMSYVWRSTMAAGTLVPFMTEVALPGDTFDIFLDCDVKTHPTLGPLFGSYKVQLDVHLAPIRLYQAQLHQNALEIGLRMGTVKLPQMTLHANAPWELFDAEGNTISPIDNSQMNPSAIFSYLNIRGLGRPTSTGNTTVQRTFNAVTFIMYWDMYKNYYANKQEEIGAVLHTDVSQFNENITSFTIQGDTFPATQIPQGATSGTGYDLESINGFHGIFQASGPTNMPTKDQIIIYTNRGPFTIAEAFGNITIDEIEFQIEVNTWLDVAPLLYGWDYITAVVPVDTIPQVATFPLTNIDQMRNNILAAVNSPDAFNVNSFNQPPYSFALQNVAQGTKIQTSKMFSQEGLALKTYQSDLFNNWLQTSWIQGPDSISEITAISTTGDEFTVDQLILAKKVYDMLNRIAISGGSYRDWIGAVYNESGPIMIQGPAYQGGLIKELMFQEVVSNSAAETADATKQPLGTLAGKGVMGKKHKGGRVHIRVEEPSYIMGIVSLTPRIDYSQGNKWDVNLKTMDDFHKPALDQIGFQDLPTDQMAWWETVTGETPADPVQFRSAGKQPAWIQYMTNVNQVRGNFADPDNEMFMTLNRRYEAKKDTSSSLITIKDLTTYIDPIKFNYIFAQTSRDAQNFWVQIGIDITARRRMSAKIIPNL